MTEEELYARPPGEFVAARNAWAKALAAEGDKSEAARVKKLPRPTASVWVANRLALVQRHALLGYLQAHLRARDRQLRALASKSETDKQLAATAARQERMMLDALMEAAPAQVAELGQAATRTLLERVRTNLRAAVIHDAHRDALERGVLARDLEEPGFSALALPLAAAKPEWLEAEIVRLESARTEDPSPPPAVQPSEAEAEAARLEAAEAQRAREAEAARRAQALERLQRAQRTEAEARGQLATAREALRGVEAERAEAEAEANRLRAALKQAEALESTRRRAEAEARQRLEGADADVQRAAADVAAAQTELSRP